ncbi:MAG: TrmH family RNA methyltransferase [Pseudomonadota bacterium]
MSATDLVGRFRAARRDPSRVVLEGFHAVKHALRFGASIEFAVAPEPAAVLALAAHLAPDVRAMLETCLEACPADDFAALAPVAPSTGVIALARRPSFEPDRLFAPSTRPVVLLEQPQHLGNVGAAVRVAAAADAAGLVVLGEVDPWHPTAVRGGAGLQFALPCGRITGLPATLARPLVIVDAKGTPLDRAALPTGSILAFGTERGGLSPALRARATASVAIPMRVGVSSLNLATAVAVVLYHRPAVAEPSDVANVLSTRFEETTMTEHPLDPSLDYPTPQALFDDPTLGRAEKMKRLVRWRFDAMRLIDSEGEGMVDGERAPLGEINRLIAELESSH